MGRKLDLLQLQVDCLVDPLNKLTHTTVDVIQQHVLLADLCLQLLDQIFIQLFLSFLYLCEQVENLTLALVGHYISTICVCDDFISDFAVRLHKLVAHSFELVCFYFQIKLDLLETICTLLNAVG